MDVNIDNHQEVLMTAATTGLAVPAADAVTLSPQIPRSRDLRLANVAVRRQSRILSHIQSFMRLRVVVINDTERHSAPLEITVHSTNTVEQVAHQVEAEYAFNSGCYAHLYHRQTSEEAARPAGDNAQGVSVEVDTSFTPLSCGMIHDANNMELKFDDVVGNVLNFNDFLYVTNTWHGPVIPKSVSRTTQDDLIELSAALLPAPFRPHLSVTVPKAFGVPDTTLDDQFNQETAVPSPFSPSALPLIEVTQYEHVSHSALPVALDTKPVLSRDSSAIFESSRSHLPLQRVIMVNADVLAELLLYSRMGLDFFREFCTSEYSLEPLLFWMDCEVYQSTADAEIRRDLAKFIYLTYIGTGAPLIVTLANEVKKELQWNVINNPTVILSIALFDEAQEDAYCMLRGYQYPRFEESSFMQSYNNKRQEEQAEFESSKINQAYALAYKPDMSFVKSVVAALEAPDSKSSFEALCKLSNGRAGITVSSAPFKGLILGLIVSHYFVHVKPNAAAAYFSHSARLTWGLKERKVAKADKLSKFFGRRVSASKLEQQTVGRTYENSDIMLASADSLGSSSSLGRNKRCKSRRKYGHGSHIRHAYMKDDPLNRRQRAGKLESVFGERLPKKHLKIQNLVDLSAVGASQAFTEDGGNDDEWEDVAESSTTLSIQSRAEMIPLATTNTLTEHQRRVLAQRSAKLKNMMGHALSEHVAAGQRGAPRHVDESNSSLDGSTGALSSAVAPAGVSSSTSEGSNRVGKNSSRRKHSTGVHASDRDLRRKRLGKLTDKFGERITQDEIDQAGSTSVQMISNPALAAGPQTISLSADERRDHLKRTAKLERIFGILPPPKSVTDNCTDTLQRSATASNVNDSPSARARRAIQNVDSILAAPSDVQAAVFDAMTNESADEIDTGLQVVVAPMVDSAAASASHRTSIITVKSFSTETSQHNKDMLQKRHQKLKRLLGHDTSDIQLAIQSQLLKDLEASVEYQVEDQGERVELKAEISKLRVKYRVPLRSELSAYSVFSNLSQSVLSGADDSEHWIPETKNVLAPEERRVLKKSAKKLHKVLGEAVNEETASSKLMARSSNVSTNSNAAATVPAGNNDDNNIVELSPRLARRSSDADFAAGAVHFSPDSPEFTAPDSREPSSATITEPNDTTEVDTREDRRRRLDKLSFILGQTISPSAFEEAAAAAAAAVTRQQTPPPVQLNEDGRKILVKKASKLERAFGS
ncbi:hypothetical protein SeMB42_g03788 [Synchytrium endobioticum]|uniref:RGS domain-containing protein n=1 Tax=Synchytrium endobioticum TaxID=286115 RepID=A0A507D4S3_9FUNG|nr:hypothetical protein SeMB42_g03788 [Synchytrium endobioticum]